MKGYTPILQALKWRQAGSITWIRIAKTPSIPGHFIDYCRGDSGLWIRIHFLRIRIQIQQFFSMRIRIQLFFKCRSGGSSFKKFVKNNLIRVFFSWKNIKDCSKVRNNGACANLLTKFEETRNYYQFPCIFSVLIWKIFPPGSGCTLHSPVEETQGIIETRGKWETKLIKRQLEDWEIDSPNILTEENENRYRYYSRYNIPTENRYRYYSRYNIPTENNNSVLD